jgi:hypothetical protein
VVELVVLYGIWYTHFAMSVQAETKFGELLPKMSVGASTDYLLLQMQHKLLLEDYQSLKRQYEQMRWDYYELCRSAILGSDELLTVARALDDQRITNALYRNFVAGLFDLLDEATRTLDSDALRSCARDIVQQFRARVALEALQQSE